MKPSLELISDSPPPGEQAAYCPNCSAEANGKFCAACGEETTVVVPSAGEFLHEFIGHYVALEGKLLQTLRILMFRPGRLTLEYLAGRRVSLISPLRLYLTLSIVVFALIRVYGIELPQFTVDGDSFGVSYTHTVQKKSARLYVDIEADGIDKQDEAPAGAATTGSPEHAVTPVPRKLSEVAVEALGKVNRQWAENLEEFVNEPVSKKSETLSYGFLAYLPYMLVGALPLFALYLKLIYLGSGRRYGEHLVFALHASAFAFLLASLMIILPGNAAWLLICLHADLFSLISIWDCLQFVPLLWLIFYLPAAMRRVYGGGYLATGGRWLVLISAHLLVISTLTIVAQVIGIVKHG